MSETNHMSWVEGLADPLHKERTEKIIDILLMRSCEFVCTIDVNKSTVNFRFMSEGIHHIAPHWKQNVDMDFETNMCGSLSSLVKEEFREEMLKTFTIPYITEMVNKYSPYITTFDLVVGKNKVLRKQLQYYWIDDIHDELLCIQTDISVAYEREKYNEKLRREASTDPLTSLPNRRGIRAILDDLAERADNLDEPFSVAMSDIDFFKKVNDTYGHNAGDKVLSEISSHIEKSIEGKGHIGRMGGEEFLIALAGYKKDEAYDILEELRKSIEDLEIEYEGQIIKITMTFGVAEYEVSGSVHDAVERADALLYYGKNNGRNRVVKGEI